MAGARLRPNLFDPFCGGKQHVTGSTRLLGYTRRGATEARVLEAKLALLLKSFRKVDRKIVL